MALTYGFYNSINHDRTYDAIQFGQIFDGIITDGIYATYLKAMVVIASENPNEVIVQPGRAWFNHTWSYNDANLPVPAPDPEVLQDRIDTLVLDVNLEQAERESKYLWVQGTPSSQNPQAPELIRSVTHNQYPLCDVYRKASTTMIYAKDITNRVGTSDTPFVTGVLEGMNIDDLLNQWDDEFHTWENTTKAQFEGWQATEKASFESWEAAEKSSFEAWQDQRIAAYNVWFQAVETQQRQDKATWDAWYAETVATLHNLPAESAEYLQLEINDIKANGMSGSYISISTINPSLAGKAVTVSNSDNTDVKTTTFDENLKARITGYLSVGDISISSTDGVQTASRTVNIPYFGNYQFAIAFWAATVNINGDEELAGGTVTVKDSNNTTIETITLDENGDGTFTATRPDTYTFSIMYEGEAITETTVVAQETTYNVTLSIFRAPINIIGIPVIKLAGKVVTVTNDLNPNVETITLDENATGTYVAKKPATYTFSADY